MEIKYLLNDLYLPIQNQLNNNMKIDNNKIEYIDETFIQAIDLDDFINIVKYKTIDKKKRKKEVSKDILEITEFITGSISDNIYYIVLKVLKTFLINM